MNQFFSLNEFEVLTYVNLDSSTKIEIRFRYLALEPTYNFSGPLETVYGCGLRAGVPPTTFNQILCRTLTFKSLRGSTKITRRCRILGMNARFTTLHKKKVTLPLSLYIEGPCKGVTLH